MKGSRSAAAAVMIGYVFGRRRKLRAATLMAAAAAVGGTTVGRIAMRRGMKMLSNTDAFAKIAPQLGEITDTVRGDLLTAAKGAASAAVTNRVGSLTDSLHDRAERLRNPGEAVAGGRGASTVGGTARRAAGRGTSRDEDEYETDEYESDEYEGDEYEPEEPEGERDDYEADEAGAAPPRRGTPRRRSPVTRAGR